MILDRRGGVLLHVTSLAGPRGIGDLGTPAHQFIDWLARAGCGLWQFLPVSPAGRGWSPYQAISSSAGDPMLISLESLADEGFLPLGDLETLPSTAQVDFPSVVTLKQTALHAAVERWRAKGRPGRDEFEAWCDGNRGWVDDFALFMALRESRPERPWTRWDPGLARREPGALARVRQGLSESIEFHRLTQFWFWRQWRRLQGEAAARGIRLIGDLPIYPDHDSADVWVRPELFKLDRTLEPAFYAGVPPDYFSVTGQLWEAPVYAWDAHRAEGFAWWIDRVRYASLRFDAVRLDHFRGLLAYWEVPTPATTAVGGRWVEAPGADVLAAVLDSLGSIPILAEDLGVITPDVIELRDRYELPGMRVLQFDLDEAAESGRVPPYPRRSAGYTGTHDNDTSRGWFNAADDRVRRSALEIVGGDGEDIAHRMIRWLWSSGSDWTLAPMQDFLSLGTEARMNHPGRRAGNWGWRMAPDSASEDLAATVLEWTHSSDRLPSRPT